MCPLGQQLPTQILTLITWVTSLEPINALISTDVIKNRHPRHKQSQACGGSRSICPVWIRLTVNFQSHPRISFSINEHWSNKYDTHKSIIIKIGLEWRTWRWFHTNHTKTPNNNTWWINNQRNKNKLYRFNCS